ncbi:MAG: glycosyltransferase [Bdellovibrionota bacterium]
MCGALCFANALGLWLLPALIRSRKNDAVNPRLATVPNGSSSRSVRSLDIILPAHNEERVIAESLKSLSLAMRKLVSENAPIPVKIRVIVALDHCTDQTESRARAAMPEVEIFVNQGAQGKWSLLTQLIGASRADWVALVDSGSVWAPELLAEWHARVSARPEIMALAPSYLPKRCETVETLHWLLEQTLKSIEGRVARGPTSVHGATVFYETATVQETLSFLKSRESNHWLNDDVVVPLTLRGLNRQRRIEYLAGHPTGGWVSDLGLVADRGAEYRRRRRMLAGNMQWIGRVWLDRSVAGSGGFCIASRRVFRVFWAYWVMLMALGLTMISPLFFGTFATIALGALFLLKPTKRIAMAFLSGLVGPVQFSIDRSLKGAAWR